jgi:hypothetical protein
MQISRDKSKQPDNEVEVEGLPVVRRNVAGIDLGSTQHWVCAPNKDGTGREVEQFGATTPELEKMAQWLKERNVESVAIAYASHCTSLGRGETFSNRALFHNLTPLAFFGGSGPGSS